MWYNRRLGSRFVGPRTTAIARIYPRPTPYAILHRLLAALYGRRKSRNWAVRSWPCGSVFPRPVLVQLFYMRLPFLESDPGFPETAPICASVLLDAPATLVKAGVSDRYYIWRFFPLKVGLPICSLFSRKAGPRPVLLYMACRAG